MLNPEAAALTNSAFLDCLARGAPEGSAIWVTSFLGSPELTEVGNWFGRQYRSAAQVDAWADRNAYFAVAALKPTADGETKRRKANFARLLALVVDDVQLEDVQGSVSWVIETSPGKTQVGIFIDGEDEAAADAGLVDRLVTNMTKRGFIGGDLSGNNSVRWVRLPVGSNLKPRDTGPWRHQLQQWHPDVVLSLEDAAAAFGVDLDELQAEQANTPAPSTGLVTGAQDERTRLLTGNIIRGENLHDSINQLAASLIASGTAGGAVVNMLRALMDSSLAAKDERWIARYQDIPRSVSTAEEKFKRPVVTHLNEQGQEVIERRLKRSTVDISVLPAVEWVLDGFIASRQLVVFAGQPGVGKSTVFSAIALLVAGFGDAMGSDVKNGRPRRVAVVSEHAEQYGRLFYGYCKRFGLDFDAVKQAIYMYDTARLTVGEIPEEIGHIIDELSGDEPPFVLLDTASAVFDVDDENNNAEIAGMIDALKKPVASTGAPVWVIAHAAKALGREDSEITPRGASAYAGDVHATGSVFQDKNIKGSTFIKSLKNRNEREFSEIEVKTEAAWHHVADEHGEIQRVGIRIGIPMMSDGEKRSMAAQAFSEAARGAEKELGRVRMSESLLIALEAAIASGQLLTASDLEAKVSGKKATKLECLNDLVTAGEVVVTEWPHCLRTHPKKTHFYRFPQTDVAALLEVFSAQKSSS